MRRPFIMALLSLRLWQAIAAIEALRLHDYATLAVAVVFIVLTSVDLRRAKRSA